MNKVYVVFEDRECPHCDGISIVEIASSKEEAEEGLYPDDYCEIALDEMWAFDQRTQSFRSQQRRERQKQRDIEKEEEEKQKKIIKEKALSLGLTEAEIKALK